MEWESARGVAPMPALVPPVGLASGPLGDAQTADREIARQLAVRARAVAEFAASRPASVDRPQGTPGAMSPQRWAARPELLREVSEWAAPELSVALSITQPAAEQLLVDALSLVHRLPGTLAALAAGALHGGHVRPLLEQVAPIADERLRAAVEADLLRWMAGRMTTPAQLGQKARREVLKRDAQAAGRRLRQVLAERGVSLRPDAQAGMATVAAFLTLPEARALYAALGAYADALPADPDDTRSRGQKMADVLLELVLRPGECELPPVRVLLTLVAHVSTALGGDAPGELDGQVVPAEMVRALLRALGGLPQLPDDSPDELDRSPVERAVASVEGPAEELSVPERVALERYWAELERRILADEMLGPEPLLTDEELAVCAAATVTAEPWLATAPLVEEGGSCPEWLPPSGEAPLDHDRVQNADGGWWAEADRAVDAAGKAMLRVQMAVGHARRLVDSAVRADAAEEAGWQAGPAGRVNAAADTIAALQAAAERQRVALGDLLAQTGGGGLAERPRLALADAVSGALLSLTDLPRLRAAAHCGRPSCQRRPERCTHMLTDRPGRGAPPPTDGYRPAAELDRFVRARDRRCRFPGCRRRVPRAGELDHDTRYPDGPTAAANLAGYCTSDHRGKHQAPGWLHRLAPDGTLTVTTPSGLTAVSTPPPY